MSTVGSQCVIKERFENVVEEVVVSAVVATRKPSQKIMWACAPILPLRHAEPALFLKKIEKHDLAHKLLGELHRAVFGLELFFDKRIFGGELLKRSINVAK